jgi:hypothetical protein
MFRRQKTVFTKNVRDTTTSSSFVDSKNISLNPVLKQMALNVTKLIKYYIEGDMESLETNLTLDIYTRYSKILFSLKKNKVTDAEIVRRVVANSLATLFSAISVYQDFKLVRENNEQLKDRANILDDMDRLKDYLEYLQQNTSTNVFGDHDITTTAASVDPEYIIYIQRHGYPLNGVFNPDLLGQIVRTITS